jgi:hypothetical protein
VEFLSESCENIDKHSLVGPPNFGKYVLDEVLDVWLHGNTVHGYKKDSFLGYLTITLLQVWTKSFIFEWQGERTRRIG